ncbi:MAG TPA: futalosine hydrolase [Chitinophagaceae bacterium]
MNILLVAATAREIEPFFEYYRKHKEWKDLDVLISGIGLTAATYHLAKQVSIKRPGLVIQAGVAGCFDHKLPLGTVVAIKREVLADQSVVEGRELRSMFDLGLLPADKFPFKNGWLVNNSTQLKNTRVPLVDAVSVNHVTTSPEMHQHYLRKFRPVTESMEGAALHFVCRMEKLPFIQLRAVSNFIGERDKAKWDMKTAIINLNKSLISLVEQFQGL